MGVGRLGRLKDRVLKRFTTKIHRLWAEIESGLMKSPYNAEGISCSNPAISIEHSCICINV